MAKTFLLLPGDGIGPEVIAEVRRVIDWLAANAGLELEVEERPYGGTAYDSHGTPLPEETRTAALKADAVLMGAVGGPQWASAPRHLRPEMALLTLRKDMDVFANLRPALCFDALADASTLKREVVAGLDIMIVRELTGGVYFGEPRGIETLADGQRRGFDTQTYTTSEIERVARVAFELARGRRNKVVSAEKSNVMESGLFWREVVTDLHKRDYADVTLEHMLADNCAMQLVKNPKQFDVIVTDNLFGDILSDEASMCTGSIGLLPSAALGAPGKPGLYEPIHGSAPDIAGKGIANPLAAILSFEMALRWSLDRTDLADRLFAACEAALNAGARTGDLGGKTTTRQMGDAVIAKL
ncbi:MAG: 3-isopropylmalate dehydrogenase [Caulobacterales bacterium 32-69-10]|nr:MAG: 3-isopropylmalate dehydrogenase [Caulobacterales bacterium 32-69-10]